MGNSSASACCGQESQTEDGEAKLPVQTFPCTGYLCNSARDDGLYANSSGSGNNMAPEAEVRINLGAKTLIDTERILASKTGDDPFVQPSKTVPIEPAIGGQAPWNWWKSLLPEDIPQDHIAWSKCRLKPGYDLVRWQVPPGNRFQTTVGKSAKSEDACEYIGRLCYVKMEEGATKEEVKEFRDNLYKVLKESEPREVELAPPRQKPFQKELEQAPGPPREGEPSPPEEMSGLTEDVPEGSAAHLAVEYEAKRELFKFKQPDGKYFKVTLVKANRVYEAGARIARLCYAKMESGATTDEMKDYRSTLYKSFQDITTAKTIDTDILKRGPVNCDCLPEDLPADSDAHVNVEFSDKDARDLFRFKITGIKVEWFDVTLRKCQQSREAAGRIARLCYAKMTSGASKEEVRQYRGVLYSQLQEGQASVSSSYLSAEKDAATQQPDEQGQEQARGVKTQEPEDVSVASYTQKLDVNSSLLAKDCPGDWWKASLPQDVTADSFLKVRTTITKLRGVEYLSFQFTACEIKMQTTKQAACNNKDAAEHIARLCYDMAQKGATKEEVKEYRGSLYKAIQAAAVELGQAPASSSSSSLSAEKGGKTQQPGDQGSSLGSTTTLSGPCTEAGITELTEVALADSCSSAGPTPDLAEAGTKREASPQTESAAEKGAPVAKKGRGRPPAVSQDLRPERSAGRPVGSKSKIPGKPRARNRRLVERKEEDTETEGQDFQNECKEEHVKEAPLAAGAGPDGPLAKRRRKAFLFDDPAEISIEVYRGYMDDRSAITKKVEYDTAIFLQHHHPSMPSFMTTYTDICDSLIQSVSWGSQVADRRRSIMAAEASPMSSAFPGM